MADFKPKLDALFNVDPFGPLNRFAEPSPNIYMESGALDLGVTSYTNVKAYLPCTLYTNKEWCPINKGITISTSQSEVDAENCPILKCDKISGTNKLSGIKAKMTSESFGCAEFVKELECPDPYGNTVRYQHQYVPKTLIDPPFLPIAPSAGVQASVGEAYLNWMDNYQRSKQAGSYTRTVKKDNANASIEVGDLELCDCDLMQKKNNLRGAVSPTKFSGKARLFVQAVFGSREDQLVVQQSDSGTTVTYLGIKGDKDTTSKARRLHILDSKLSKIYTDSMGNYYLMRISSNVSMNPLEPSPEGLLVQKWLKLQNLARKEKSIYEAYILSSCTPTKNVSISGSSLNAYSKGMDIGGYGWKPNWSGRTCSIVTFDWGRPHKSYLYSVNIEMNDSAAFYQAEIDRKKASIVEYRDYLSSLTTMPQEEKDALVPTLKYVYFPRDPITTDVTVNVIDPEADPPLTENVTTYCISGDIEIGSWKWIILNDFNMTEEHDQLKKDLETKNKTEGELPYSKEYFTNLASEFSVQETLEDSGEFAFKYHNHRVFSYDPMFGVYNLELAYSNEPSELVGVPGSGPVYCFYDNKDNLKVISYVYERNAKTVGGGYTEYSPSPCGDSWSRLSSKTKDRADYAAFVVSGLEVSCETAPIYNQSESSMSKDCGGRTGCESPPPHPGPCNILCCGALWYKNYRGAGKVKSFSFGGGLTSRIALVIPKGDSESVFLATGKFFNGSYNTFQGDYEKCVCASDMAPQRDAVRWSPCFSKGKTCSSDGCCNKIQYQEPIEDSNTYKSALGCSHFGVFYPNMKKAVEPSGKIPTSGGTICTIWGHQYFAYRPETDAYRPATASDQCGEEWKLVPLNYTLSLDVFDEDGTKKYSGNCKGGKEVSEPISGESTSVKVYCINRTDNTMVLKEAEGFGDLEELPANSEAFPSQSKMTGAGWEWAGYGQFLGYIDPMFPYVYSSVDIHQSALGLWWTHCPSAEYSVDYPFDKKGRYFIGAC